MPYIQRHPILEPLVKIKHHQHLNKHQIKLLELEYPLEKTTYSLIKNGIHLSVLASYYCGKPAEYYCDQFDYPLRALNWFPKTLQGFINGEIYKGEGGGAMTTPHLEVDGEFLAVDRGSQGYGINNWSRSSHSQFGKGFEPTMLSLDNKLLYDCGLLKEWTILGEKYKQGQI